MIRQGIGLAQQSIVLMSRDEALELAGIIVSHLTEDAAATLRATADRLHDAADRIEGTALTELLKDITTT